MGGIIFFVFVAICWFALHEVHPFIAWALVVVFAIWAAWFYGYREQVNDSDENDAKTDEKVYTAQTTLRPGRFWQKKYWTQGTKVNTREHTWKNLGGH